jgi:hypothetical protein
MNTGIMFATRKWLAINPAIMAFLAWPLREQAQVKQNYHDAPHSDPNQNALNHGRCTTEAIALRQETRDLIRAARAILS